MKVHDTEKLLSNFTPASITGCLTPFQSDGQPWFVHLPNNPNYWVPVFSTVEKLEAGCVDLNINDYFIKEISDGLEFIESIKIVGLRVMLNPYSVREENKTRWTEIVLPWEE